VREQGRKRKRKGNEHAKNSKKQEDRKEGRNRRRGEADRFHQQGQEKCIVGGCEERDQGIAR
jgi:hypothetical protein